MTTLKGTVVDQAGKPVAGAFVYFDASARKTYPSLFETHTSDTGAFTLVATVAPGRYDITLVVNAAGYRSATLPLRTIKTNVVVVTLAAVESGAPSHIVLLKSK